ncbi:hypothetical protein H0A66_16960 [Alcaligenaceae bacterium]|nr:hypothetical protein [Alcaligenaceae bacterium]
MENESRLSITIDSQSAEQQVKDLEKAFDALESAGIRVVGTMERAGKTVTAAGRTFSAAGREATRGPLTMCDGVLVFRADIGHRGGSGKSLVCLTRWSIGLMSICSQGR